MTQMALTVAAFDVTDDEADIVVHFALQVTKLFIEGPTEEVIMVEYNAHIVRHEYPI